MVEFKKASHPISMLYHYWKYYDRLRPSVQTLKYVFIALLIPIVVAVMIICAAMLMKPKRKLHGSAPCQSYGNHEAWSFEKKFTGDEEPDLLIGKIW